MTTLRDRFDARMREAGSHLTIAVTPRLLVEDLAPCVAEFHSQSPDTRFRFVEAGEEGVLDIVEARRADFGFSPTLLTEEQQQILIAEPGYSVEVRLITPKDHPLARRRRVHSRDLRPYPLLNSPFAYPSSNIRLVLDQHGVRQTGHRVQVDYTASIRRFVELGCGIGLIHAVPSAGSPSHLHERPMSRYFNNVSVRVIRRQGGFLSPSAEAFIGFVRRRLGKGAP